MGFELIVTTSILWGFVGLIVLAALLGGPFLYVGAKLAMIEKATLGRATLAAMGSSVTGWALTGILYPVPLCGSCSGFMIGLAASLVIIKMIFDTTTAKAFTVLVFLICAQMVAFLFALITFAPGLHSYLTLPLPPG